MRDGYCYLVMATTSSMKLVIRIWMGMEMGDDGGGDGIGDGQMMEMVCVVCLMYCCA